MTLSHPLSACLLILSLSACGSWGYQRGVGFTGIDGEPRSVAEANGQPDIVTRAQSPLERLASLPAPNLRTEPGPQSDLAAVAIANGAGTPQGAAPVRLDGQELMLSMVRVNGQMFGVLKVPDGNPGRMGPGAAAAFTGSAERLTGCLPTAGAYAHGGADRPKGLAVPLNCS